MRDYLDYFNPYALGIFGATLMFCGPILYAMLTGHGI